MEENHGEVQGNLRGDSGEGDSFAKVGKGTGGGESRLEGM